MNINSVSNAQAVSAYQTYKKADANLEKKNSLETAEPNNGVIYEPNTELIEKMKKDAEERTAQLKSLVEKLITNQGKTLGQANDIWKFLASGDFSVDAATKAKAQEDISENGYWGVEQTSERIINFATALTGGDPDKVEEMRAAFQEGFKQATKTWGDDLPEISQKTYDAVMLKFDKLAGKSETTDENNTNQKETV